MKKRKRKRKRKIAVKMKNNVLIRIKQTSSHSWA